MFSSFEKININVTSATIHARVGGSGPALLLLHGYPQTHVMWHVLVDELAKFYRVVVPDLRGYGDSVSFDHDFTFRTMARDQVELMSHLGFNKFDVVAHDRGARTAHRMVLDYPSIVRSIALLDILPTLEVWRTMDDWLAKCYYHWMFLSQPGDMPQKLINSDPVMFLHAALLGLSGKNNTFDPRALAEYERAAKNPDVVAAWCGDYTEGASTDLEHDRADEQRTSDIPCLVLWGTQGVVAHHIDPLKSWQFWFPKAVGHAINAGHFLVEEKPAQVLKYLRMHLNESTYF